MGVRAMSNIVLVLLSLICAIQDVHSPQLITIALWLAGVSAMIAGMLYRLGAYDVLLQE
jgi:hypothetical protein